MTSPIRQALGAHLGQVLTPELAALIEQAAFFAPDESHDPAKFGTQSYRGYVFAVERLSSITDEIHPLHEAHFLETEKYRLGFGLSVNYPHYLVSERMGSLVQFTLRKEGELVGNIRMFIGTSLHTGTQYATEDTFYVLPEHRKGFLAIRFWQFMEASMAAIGALEIRTDSKLLNHVNRLNEYCGYTAVATKFVKILGAPHVQRHA